MLMQLWRSPINSALNYTVIKPFLWLAQLWHVYCMQPFFYTAGKNRIPTSNIPANQNLRILYGLPVLMDKQSLVINLIFMNWTQRQQMPPASESHGETRLHHICISFSYRLSLSTLPVRKPLLESSRERYQWCTDSESVHFQMWNFSQPETVQPQMVSRAMALFERLGATPNLAALLSKIEALTFEIFPKM